MPDHYKSDAEHLLDELKRLDLMLQDLVSRKGRADPNDPFRGLYLTAAEADALLGGNKPREGNQDSRTGREQRKQAGDKGKEEEARAADFRIQEKVKRSLEAGIGLRLWRLSRLYDLDALEKGAVIICAAAELDSRYEKIYGYLQDDMTRKSPSLGLVLDILCSTPEERIKARRRFLPGSRLIKERIIEPVLGGEGDLQLSSALRLNPEVLAGLIGSYRPEEGRLPGQAGTSGPSADISESLQARLKNLTICLARKKGRAICHIQGPYGCGKRHMASRICAALGKKMAKIDLAALMADEKGFVASLSRDLRLALLEGRAVYMEKLELLAAEDPGCLQMRSRLAGALESYPGLVILSSTGPVDLGPALQSSILALKVPLPEYPERRRAWARALAGRLSQEDADDLASKFRFTAGQIADAVLAAAGLASLEGRPDISREDVYSGCRLQSSRNLSTLSKRVQSAFSWEDIILPRDRIEQLREIKSHVQHQGTVYSEWGFGKKLSLGLGLNILFSGVSGTGKTLAAGVLAAELGLEMYKVDLSTLVSKYIGETEKNLSRIFQEAEQGNAILFFDEADAIFGKRSEVRDAHDRYANLEIGYLLQKMEEHQGIVILATNLRENMDESFTRRMHFIVEFPFPEVEYRRLIWKTLLPAKAPVAKDVDYDFLARRLQVAGGNIKNILVSAAFLAAENSGIISMEHIIRAAGEEYRKVGMVCSQSDFGKYYPLACS